MAQPRGIPNVSCTIELRPIGKLLRSRVASHALQEELHDQTLLKHCAASASANSQLSPQAVSSRLETGQESNRRSFEKIVSGLGVILEVRMTRLVETCCAVPFSTSS